MKTNRLFLVPLFLLIVAPVVLGQVPVGDEVQVNTYTTDSQWGPTIASDANGNFVVSWTNEEDLDPYYSQIDAQLFDANGNASGAEFTVSSDGYYSYEPDVAQADAGNFIVVWTSWGTDAEATAVRGQRVDGTGTFLGSEFSVNTTEDGYQYEPEVSSDSSGNFVVVWTGPADSYAYYGGIFGQRLDTSGNPVGSEFSIGNSLKEEWGPDTASDTDGDFVVVWTAYYDSEGGIYGPYLYGQRYDSYGAAQGTNFRVDTNGGDHAAVAMDGTGNFVVVWTGGDYLDEDVLGQRFDSSGNTVGTEFLVNTYTPGRQLFPAVSMSPTGDFVVTWDGPGDNLEEVFAQRFAPDGAPSGDELMVNTETLSNQRSSVVTVKDDGDLVVAWESNLQDGDALGVFAQRFAPPLPDELAADFGASGMWHYETSWTQLTNWDAELLETWGNKIVGDFGANLGLWVYDQTTGWTKITAWDPYILAVWGDKLVAAFDSGRGIWLFDGTWSQLTNWEPTIVVPWGDTLAAAFDSGRGVWQYDTGWTQLTTWTPYDMVAWGSELVGAFDSGRGLWTYDATWTKLSAWEPESGILVPWGDQLAAGFGSGRGTWLYDTTSGWIKISSWDCYELVAWQDKLLGAFDSGRGLWQYGAGSWSSSTNWEPELGQIIPLADKLAVDFGTGRGMWFYEQSIWTKVTAWDAEIMEPSNLFP